MIDDDFLIGGNIFDTNDDQLVIQLKCCSEMAWKHLGICIIQALNTAEYRHWFVSLVEMSDYIYSMVLWMVLPPGQGSAADLFLSKYSRMTT